jgi:predicted nuclease of predicted toxin-antitoxin system
VRLLTDENFNGAILRGLVRRLPELDIVRVQDVGLIHTDDPDILEWAANQRRILLTHDVATLQCMPTSESIKDCLCLELLRLLQQHPLVR